MSQDKSHAYNDYVSSLLDRIEVLEANTKSCESPTQNSVLATATITPERRHGDVESYALDVDDPPPPIQRGRQANRMLSEQTSPVDAMGASATIESDGTNPDRFYGGSSFTSLMRQAYQAISSTAPASKSTNQRHMDSQSGPISQGVQVSCLEHLEQFTLPPRHLVDDILEIYWTKVHHLYPFVHKPTFMLAYERLWTPDYSDPLNVEDGIDMLGSSAYGHKSAVFHCALNLFLALGTQFMDVSVDEKAKLGYFFGQKARSLCSLDFFDDGSLAVIQTLLTMTQYLQSTPFPARCWNCIGITCRLAQGLGLYCVKVQMQGALSSLRTEMHRRVWHGCVMLDAVVSLTLGRPLMLYAFRSVPLPQAIDDEYLTQGESRQEYTPSRMHFYIESLKIYELLADIADKVYGKSNIDHTTAEKEVSLQTLFSNISQIDLDLVKVESAFPDHLHPVGRLSTSDDIKNSPIYRQQAYVLQTRVLHLRLLLYLPIFIRYCHNICTQELDGRNTNESDIAPTELSLAIIQSVTRRCVESSIQLIDIVHESSLAALTGAWWYNLLFLRTASVIVLLCMANESTYNLLGMERLRASWTQSQQALEHLQSCSVSSTTCLQELRQLYEYVTDFKTRRTVGTIPLGEQLHEGEDDGGALIEPSLRDAFMGPDYAMWPSDLETSLFDELFRFN